MEFNCAGGSLVCRQAKSIRVLLWGACEGLLFKPKLTAMVRSKAAKWPVPLGCVFFFRVPHLCGFERNTAMNTILKGSETRKLSWMIG